MKINNQKKQLLLVIKIFGLTVAILSFVWMILFFGYGAMGAGISYDMAKGHTPTQEQINALNKFKDSTRYIACSTIILSFVLFALILTFTIIQLLDIKKSNLKGKLSSLIVGTIVLALLFTFSIVGIINCFDNTNWYQYINYCAMGVICVCAIYNTTYSFVKQSTQFINKDENIVLHKTLWISTIISSSVVFIPIILICIGSMQNNTTTGILGPKFLYVFFITSTLIAWFVAVLIISSAIMLLLMNIYSSIAKKTSDVIKWSVTGGIALILAIVFAVYCPSINNKRWENYRITASFIGLASFIISLIGVMLAIKSIKELTVVKSKSNITTAAATK